MAKQSFFECKVEFVTGQTNTGKNKTTKAYMLVDAMAVTEAEAKITDHLNAVEPNSDWTVTSAKESKIEEVIG